MLECLCCGSAYRYSGADFVSGIPKRNPACLLKESKPAGQPMKGALLVAASLVAAIRLRGAEIRESPKLHSTIQDSITLARMVLSRLSLIFLLITVSTAGMKHESSRPCGARSKKYVASRSIPMGETRACACLNKHVIAEQLSLSY